MKKIVSVILFFAFAASVSAQLKVDAAEELTKRVDSLQGK
jgi:Ni/Co efflux regulator RcnB